MTGCASPGLPKAPSLNLPRPTADLTAQRRGPVVHLEWNTPDRNTDGLLLDPPSSRKKYLAPTAEICRTEVLNSASCTVTGRTPAHPGASESYDDTLSPELQTGLPRLVQYRVRLLNAAGRGVAPASVLVPVGKAPPPTADLRVRAVRQGAELAWNPANDTVPGDTIHILRRSVDVAPAPAPVHVRKPKSIGKILKGSSSNQIEAFGLRLAADPDPGGAVDATITSGQRYLYTVARERTVTLAGHAYLVSSDLVTVTTTPLEDHFAPRPPAGLASIATPGTDGARASIDLSWEPSTETDVAGYLIYRQDAAAGAATKLTPQIQPGTAFHDEAVLAGHKYVYWVTAVDRSGNESPRSSSTEETLP
jgi:hypothetical protein